MQTYNNLQHNQHTANLFFSDYCDKKWKSSLQGFNEYCLRKKKSVEENTKSSRQGQKNKRKSQSHDHRKSTSHCTAVFQTITKPLSNQEDKKLIFLINERIAKYQSTTNIKRRLLDS